MFVIDLIFSITKHRQNLKNLSKPCKELLQYIFFSFPLQGKNYIKNMEHLNWENFIPSISLSSLLFPKGHP